MLEYINLKNFKSFSDITLDLRDSHKRAKKMAFIYGENGSGKSNLMFSLLFLNNTFNTLRNQEQMKHLKNPKIEEILSEENNDLMKKELISQILRSQFASLAQLIKENKTIKNDETMSVEIGFCLQEKKGTYSLIFDNESVVFEELRFQINERIGTIYSINEDKITLSPSIFIDSTYKSELQDNIEKYWGKHTFMSILFNERESKNKKYIDERIHSNLLKVIAWLNKLCILCKNNNRGQTAKVSIPYKFLQSLENGIIEDENDKELKSFEKILNTFFTQLYSDIKRVYYKIDPVDEAYRYELVFEKLINGKLKEIPFSLESTGTQKLLDIFPLLFSAIFGSTVFIDEIDSGIHDMLMCAIIESLRDSIKGQIIITTHNTLLMKELPIDSVYIIRSDANGYKEIACVNDYDFRTQKTNNTQLKYLAGDYSGVPYVGCLDFDEMIDEIAENLDINNDL